jgi:competence protein ComEC
VLRIRYGSQTFLLTGDIERVVEDRILAETPPGPVDVLKVAHHGSKTSTAVEWIETTHPQVALISAGEANMYRLPHAGVISRLNAAHTAVYRTDLFGLVHVHSDGQRLSVATYRTDPGGEVLDAVFSPD